MKSIASLATGFVALTILTHATTAQEGSQLVGVWKLKIFERKEIATGKTVRSYGENPSGYLHLTKGGRVITEGFAESRKAPATPQLTDAERVDLFKTMYAYSGTYKLEGDKLIFGIDASWNQAWTGTNQVFNKVTLSGSTLSIETAPFKAVVDGVDVIITVTYDRVE